jgi:hypothetical protein
VLDALVDQGADGLEKLEAGIAEVLARGLGARLEQVS